MRPEITPARLQRADPQAVLRLARFLGVRAGTWTELLARLMSACRPTYGRP